MLVDPSDFGAGARAAGASRQASQAIGASFNYLLAPGKPNRVAIRRRRSANDRARKPSQRLMVNDLLRLRS
jgi:hypothetical protein